MHVPAGLDAAARRVLDRLTRLWTREGNDWQLVLEAMGAADQFAQASALVRKSREWLSVTPYLHPWHVKKRTTVEDQIRRECRERRERGLAEPVSIETMTEIEVGGGTRRRPVHFHRFRSKRGLIQPDTQGSFRRLRFEEPVSGPLALGFACHFGLGLFGPAPRDDPAGDV